MVEFWTSKGEDELRHVKHIYDPERAQSGATSGENKVTKALLPARGIEAGIEHRLEDLFKRFADDDAWPARLRPFAGYSAYATAFRDDLLGSAADR